MVNRFILNEVSYFGPGARKELPAVVNRLGLKKALVVTDKGLVKFGVAKMVTDVLDEAGIPFEMYSEVKPNPTVTNVKMGVDAFAPRFFSAGDFGENSITRSGISPGRHGIFIDQMFHCMRPMAGTAPFSTKESAVIPLGST